MPLMPTDCTAAVNSYKGEYMSRYSWAEMTLGAIEKKRIKNPCNALKALHGFFYFGTLITASVPLSGTLFIISSPPLKSEVFGIVPNPYN